MPARIAAQLRFDLLDGHAVHQLGDGFEIAVAAAGEADAGDDVAVEAETDLDGADVFRSVCIRFHLRTPPLIVPASQQTANAAISMATIVEPTGVSASTDTRMPSAAVSTE